MYGFLALSALVGVGYRVAHPGAPAARTEAAAAARPTSSPTGEGATTGATTPTAPASAGPTGTVVPAFQVASLNAGTVRVPMAKPTVVYFMSAGCGSCISGEQQLAHVAAETPTSVQWLSLDVDPGYDTRQAVLNMAQSTGAHWPQAFATNAIINAYYVTQLDMVAVIAKNGTLLYDGALPSNTRLITLIHQAEA